MFKRLVSVLVVVMMILSLTVGCSNNDQPKTTEPSTTEPPKTEDPASTTEPEPEGEPAEDLASEGILVWNLGVDPETWDPGLNAATDGGHVINNLFDGLTRETRTGGIEPAQAESWEMSDDGLTWTFKLREGLKWSDGSPLTAKDFEYSWKRAADPVTASEYATMMTNYIAGAQEFFLSSEDERQAARDAMGVKAIDDTTLEVKLINPVPYFLSLVSFYTFAPVKEDIVEANGEGWEKNAANCISNGPFKLTEYQTGSHLSMVKNENYWDAANVKLNGIQALMIVEGTTALNGYESGEIQVLDGIVVDEIPRLQRDDPYFAIVPQVGTYYVNFNVDDPTMSNVSLRKAFALAMDRAKFVEQVTKGGQVPATGFIPSSLNYSDGNPCRELDENGIPVPEFGIDPNQALADEAKALMAEAGYPNGEGLPEITFLYNTNDNNKRIAEALQGMWKENLGVDVKLRNEDWAVFQESRRNGNYQIARGGWIGDYADPMTMLELFTASSGNNDPQWRYREDPTAPHDKTLNPEQKDFEDQIIKARETSGTDRDAALKAAEQIFMDNMPAAPIYYYTMSTIVDESKVEGVELTPTTKWDFRHAYMVD